jgi:hypothetical protein
MFVTDYRLPDDVVRRRYAETKHALCCLNCGFEYGFDPTQAGSIGKPLWVFWSMSAGLRRAECVGQQLPARNSAKNKESASPKAQSCFPKEFRGARDLSAPRTPLAPTWHCQV